MCVGCINATCQDKQLTTSSERPNTQMRETELYVKKSVATMEHREGTVTELI
jgi:hypothetical protein